MTAPLVTGLGTCPFTSGGQGLLAGMTAAGCQLVFVQSSSVDAWVTKSSSDIGRKPDEQTSSAAEYVQK